MIIDSHTHIGILPPFYMTPDMLLRSMERFGIDFSLVSNIEAAEKDHEGKPVPPAYQVPQNELLRKTLAVVKQAPDRLGLLPWLRIGQELPDREFVSLLKENRSLIYGFKLHPFHSRTAPDDERLEPVYRLAAEYGLPVVSHTGGCEEAMSEHLCNAAKRHPEIDFVMVHMDLGTDNPIDGENTLLHNPKGDRSLYQQYFHELKEQLTAEEYADLMYRNAQRVFRIN